MNEIIWRARWSKEQIRVMLLEQAQAFWQKETGIDREKITAIEQAIKLPHAVIISGLRRVGKSTLLAQLAHRLGQDAFYYLNFEDDRFLGFQAEDASDLFQILTETFGERKVFIIDEIQNIPAWEHFVRRFMDLGFKFYISGSNASLLSRELGTRLTGRYLPLELFPFSFTEYLKFTSQALPDLQRLTTVDRARLNSLLDSYLRSGGIPEALKYPDLPLLRSLYDDILFRDIAARYHLEAVTALKELAYFLVSNPSGKVSFNKLKEQLRLGSVNTVTSFIDYLQNSWLIFSVNLYDFSVKRQQTAPKKIYCIDTGLSTSVGFHFSPDTGELLENLVFLALRRQTSQIYYYSSSEEYEVDFYLPEAHQLIQVSHHMEAPGVRERERRALEHAIHKVKVERALILTDHNEDSFGVSGIPVEVKSIAEWLISN